MKYDFAGWVTKNDIQCSDGVTIRHGAFAEQDGVKVPLVWEHRHDNPENVLGHIILEHRDEGVYGYAKCNSTPNGQNAKIQVKEGDITSFSIYANKVQKKGTDVVHGVIREVSLVLSGANPGAMILEHSDMGKSLAQRSDVDGIVIYHDDFNGSLISEISHGENSAEQSEIATPASASDAEGKTNADSIGNLSADTLGRHSSNSLSFCTDCGTRARGRFCGNCGANLTIDSNEVAVNAQPAPVQHTYNPTDSLVDNSDETVLAHDGDSTAGESGAQGDGPKSDSNDSKESDTEYYEGLATDLIACYGTPEEGVEDCTEYYVSKASKDFDLEQEDIEDIEAVCEVLNSVWSPKVEHNLRARLRRIGGAARDAVARAASNSGTRAGAALQETLDGAVGAREGARNIARGARRDFSELSERLQARIRARREARAQRRALRQSEIATSNQNAPIILHTDGYTQAGVNQLMSDIVALCGLPTQGTDTMVYYVTELYHNGIDIPEDSQFAGELQVISEVIAAELGDGEVAHTVVLRRGDIETLGNLARSGVRNIVDRATRGAGELSLRLAERAEARGNSAAAARHLERAERIAARVQLRAQRRAERDADTREFDRAMRNRGRSDMFVQQSDSDQDVITHNNRTIEDVLATLNDEQQSALAFLLNALEQNGQLSQSDIGSVSTIMHTYNEEQQECVNFIIETIAESV